MATGPIIGNGIVDHLVKEVSAGFFTVKLLFSHHGY